MISIPQIVHDNSHDAAVIKLHIPRSEMMNTFGPAVNELLSILDQQGIEPVGAIFAHHLKMSPDKFEFEIGIKIVRPIAPSGRVLPGKLPGGMLARTIYTGPYEGLPGAWAEFKKWLGDNKLDQSQNLWEVYSIGPQSNSNSQTWQTELNQPIKS